jgi:hypothetical protein
MKLPKDLLSGNYTKPRLFLCEPDKEIICPLKTNNLNGSFKFNSYSELSFEASRIYNDIITGENKVSAGAKEGDFKLYIDYMAYERDMRISVNGEDGVTFDEVETPKDTALQVLFPDV